jgi:hypothetical protein
MFLFLIRSLKVSHLPLYPDGKFDATSTMLEPILAFMTPKKRALLHFERQGPITSTRKK